MRTCAYLIALAATCLTVPAAGAADFMNMQPAPSYSPAAFSFDGFYLGAQGGGVLGSSFNAGSIGVVAGANFTVADPVIAGIEFQADALIKGSGTTYDFYALGRLGVMVTGDFMAYAEAGPGWSNSASGYAFGGGGEFALTDSLSLKAEVQGVGNWGNGPSGARLQAGLLFNLQ